MPRSRSGRHDQAVGAVVGGVGEQPMRGDHEPVAESNQEEDARACGVVAWISN